jgi:N-acyl homoserine lactone hydrolase
VTAVRKLFILLCGFEILPKTISTRNKGKSFVMSLPVCAYLLDTSRGYVLIDTGFNTNLIKDPVSSKKYFGRHHPFPPPVVLEEHELLTQLEKLGVQPADIHHVLLSHLHVDHAGNLRHFRHARIYIQQSELEHALSDQASGAYVQEDYLLAGLDWQKVRGDWELMPGLEGWYTPGHSPGHQSFRVTLPNTGSMILVADAGDLRENFEHEILPGAATDDEAALRSIQRLNEAARGGDWLVLGHDPVILQELKLAPAYYD